MPHALLLSTDVCWVVVKGVVLTMAGRMRRFPFFLLGLIVAVAAAVNGGKASLACVVMLLEGGFVWFLLLTVTAVDACKRGGKALPSVKE